MVGLMRHWSVCLCRLKQTGGGRHCLILETNADDLEELHFRQATVEWQANLVTNLNLAFWKAVARCRHLVIAACQPIWNFETIDLQRTSRRPYKKVMEWLISVARVSLARCKLNFERMTTTTR